MIEHDELALLAVAQEAAAAAAEVLRARFGQRQQGVHAKSTPTDLVSDADVAAEAAIREVLAARRPSDSILAEEGGQTDRGELRWIVDPLDGTINFLFSIPVFAVSVACEGPSGTLAGVVLDPLRDECFAAVRSGTPTLNGDPLPPAPHAATLASALIATGFAYDSATRARQAQIVTRVLPRVRDIRRLGSAALDLAWSAAGRYDGYYERGVKPWDVAAGALIANRAGLKLRELATTAQDPFGLVVAPAGLIGELEGLVSGELD